MRSGTAFQDRTGPDTGIPPLPGSPRRSLSDPGLPITRAPPPHPPNHPPRTESRCLIKGCRRAATGRPRSCASASAPRTSWVGSQEREKELKSQVASGRGGTGRAGRPTAGYRRREGGRAGKTRKHCEPGRGRRSDEEGAAGPALLASTVAPPPAIIRRPPAPVGHRRPRSHTHRARHRRGRRRPAPAWPVDWAPGAGRAGHVTGACALCA